MHPLRKLRESGRPTAAQISELLAENAVFNSHILVRPIRGSRSSRGHFRTIERYARNFRTVPSVDRWPGAGSCTRSGCR